MTFQNARIFIFSGTPASGKSTIAKELLQEFSFGIHIPVDSLRGWVVSGISDPIGSWNKETDRQFRLARDAAANIARIYASRGFAVAIDDVIFPYQVQTHYKTILVDLPLHKIMLRPSIEIALARNGQREKAFDLSSLDALIPRMYEAFGQEDLSDWVVIDSSDLTIKETVQAILKHL